MDANERESKTPEDNDPLRAYALQNAASYPNVFKAVKSGRAWFTQGASQASSWLVGSTDLRNKLSTG